MNLNKEVSEIKTNRVNREREMKKQSKAFKNLFMHRLSVLSFILFASAFLMVGCSTLQVESDWRDREITINGKSDDWLGALYFFEKENISAGFLNDKNYIYICLVAENPLIRNQLMWQGFTLWFDPDGGKDKTLGIKFPIGRQESRPLMRGREGGREGLPDVERFQEALEKSLAELEILEPGKDEHRKMPVEEAEGIDIKLEVSSGLLVYELKVPLLADEQHPYAVGVEAGSSIGIGLEVPKIDLGAMRERVGGRQPGGMGMPGGGIGRGGGVGMPGGRRPQMPRGLKVWLAVQLASGESSVSD
jgi:hypothetical protein